MFQIKIVQKIKTYILYKILFLKNSAVYEIMWKHFVQPDRRTGITCWITTATNTHSEYVTLVAFP